ncbi:MAG: hypothetical protein KDI02_10130 [Anaerolineae bacterium]|nr:hypothetical protein [Anaerolineae bacterium]MCB0224036.1 hypothetical protein [Anaerolineae bacterium]
MSKLFHHENLLTTIGKAIACIGLLMVIVGWWGYADVSAQDGEVDVISNGSFEQRNDPSNGVAADWEPYDNGQAHFGWYDEQWPEAVRMGDYSQLMEIKEVYNGATDRVIAIYQTVDVATNADYALTLYAIMRTDDRLEERNDYEYEMQWGVDPLGEGNIENVDQWVVMPLTEQLRIGSNGEYPDNEPLMYQVVTGTIRTGADNSRISLFIRGIKKFASNAEVNFNVDDVSLVGPAPGSTISNIPQAAPPDEESPLPVTGLNTEAHTSIPTLLFGGLVLVMLGGVATAKMLRRE